MSAAPTFLTRFDRHIQRRFYHFFMGTVLTILFAYVWTRREAQVLAVTLVGALLILEVIRLKVQAVNRFAFRLFGPIMRESEKEGPSAQLHYGLGICFCVLFLPKPIVIQSVLTLAWMDPVAAIFGMKFGKKTWSKFFEPIFFYEEKIPETWAHKTIVGSLMGFLAAFLAGILAWTGPWASVPLASGGLFWPSPQTILVMSAVGGLTAMMAEAWPSQWDDNINVPMWTGLVLWALTFALMIPVSF